MLQYIIKDLKISTAQKQLINIVRLLKYNGYYLEINGNIWTQEKYKNSYGKY